jgi:hypothetical protein
VAVELGAGADAAGAGAPGAAAGADDRDAGLGLAAAAGIWSSTEEDRGRSIDKVKLLTMNTPARMVVARDRRFADPRGPNAVCVPPPPNALARSWFFPCCSRTTPMRKREATMWRVMIR